MSNFAVSIKLMLLVSILYFPLLQAQTLKNGSLFCSSENEKVIELYNFGIKSLEHGKIDFAKRAFQKATDLDSTFCDAYTNLAYIYRQQGELITALYLLDISLKIHPDNPAALQNYAYYWLLANKPLRSKENYNKLIKLQPSNPEGYYGLGMALMELKEYNMALSNTKTAIELYNKADKKLGDEVYYLLGMNHFHLEHYDSALFNLEKVYDGYSDEMDINYALAICYLKLNENSKAKEFMIEAESLGAEIPVQIKDEVNKK